MRSEGTAVKRRGGPRRETAGQARGDAPGERKLGRAASARDRPIPGARETARSREQGPGGERRRQRRRGRQEGNARREARRLSIGRKALRSEPQGRQRDETSPRGAWRSKPSGGCETLEAERSRARQARRRASDRASGLHAPRASKGKELGKDPHGLERSARVSAGSDRAAEEVVIP
jgi:hypothetical protein